jgi:vancomycin permeability regulator SanA
MNDTNDNIIILSHRLNRNNSLTEQCTQRLDKGIEEYKNGKGASITMAGDLCYQIKIPTLPVGEQMKYYAIARGVEKRKIYVDNLSLNTVSQAIFLKKNLILPQHWKKLLIVTHNYHLSRVKEIFNFIYGDGFQLNYAGIEDERLDNNSSLKNDEEKSLALFYNAFKGADVSNISSLEKKLFKEHPYFKGKKRITFTKISLKLSDSDIIIRNINTAQ